MDFFDCNSCYGRPPVPSYRIAPTPTDLLAEMDWNGIGEALVTSAQQRYDDPAAANVQVVRDCSGHPRLHPTWVVMPQQTGEFPSADDLPASLNKAGVKALWAFPARNKYMLDRNTFGPMLELLSDLQVPLFLSITDNSGPYSGWALMSAVLADFPRLTLVAADQDCWGQDRFFRPLVEKYPRFYFDVYEFELAHGYEDYCAKYGPDRMLFASGFPTISMGAQMLNLLHTNIKDNWKEAIAGGNLRRLLTEVRL